MDMTPKEQSQLDRLWPEFATHVFDERGPSFTLARPALDAYLLAFVQAHAPALLGPMVRKEIEKVGTVAGVQAIAEAEVHRPINMPADRTALINRACEGPDIGDMTPNIHGIGPDEGIPVGASRKVVPDENRSTERKPLAPSVNQGAVEMTPFAPSSPPPSGKWVYQTSGNGPEVSIPFGSQERPPRNWKVMYIGGRERSAEYFDGKDWHPATFVPDEAKPNSEESAVRDALNNTIARSSDKVKMACWGNLSGPSKSEERPGVGEVVVFTGPEYMENPVWVFGRRTMAECWINGELQTQINSMKISDMSTNWRRMYRPELTQWLSSHPLPTGKEASCQSPSSSPSSSQSSSVSSDTSSVASMDTPKGTTTAGDTKGTTISPESLERVKETHGRLPHYDEAGQILTIAREFAKIRLEGEKQGAKDEHALCQYTLGKYKNEAESAQKSLATSREEVAKLKTRIAELEKRVTNNIADKLKIVNERDAAQALQSKLAEVFQTIEVGGDNVVDSAEAVVSLVRTLETQRNQLAAENAAVRTATRGIYNAALCVHNRYFDDKNKAVPELWNQLADALQDRHMLTQGFSAVPSPLVATMLRDHEAAEVLRKLNMNWKFSRRPTMEAPNQYYDVYDLTGFPDSSYGRSNDPADAILASQPERAGNHIGDANKMGRADGGAK